MSYKFNRGRGAYLCDKCSTLIAIGIKALGMKQLREKFYCEE